MFSGNPAWIRHCSKPMYTKFVLIRLKSDSVNLKSTQACKQTYKPVAKLSVIILTQRLCK